jgi:hypothetical protein
VFVWLISHQPAVLFSQNKPATNNQPAVVFSQNKSAPAISATSTNRLGFSFRVIDSSLTILLLKLLHSALFAVDCFRVHTLG